MNPNQQQMSIDITQTEPLECTECKSTTFTQVFLIRVLPALLSPSGKKTPIPLQTYQCSKCHLIPDMYMPKIQATDEDI